MPKYINKLLLACYKSPTNYGWFMVHSDKLNNWLTNKFGVYTNEPIFDLPPYQAKFNWISQTWNIK